MHRISCLNFNFIIEVSLYLMLFTSSQFLAINSIRMAFAAQIRRRISPNHFYLLQKALYSDAFPGFSSELEKIKVKNHVRILPSVPVQLVRKTTKQLLKELNSIYDSVLCVDIRKLQPEHMDVLIRNSIEEKNGQDLNFLVNECLKWNVAPSISTSLEVLQHYESCNQFENLEKFFDFCLEQIENPFALQLFKVKFYWNEGNVDKSLSLLDKIHNEARQRKNGNKDDLMACKEMFQELILDSGKKSEAVLRKLIHLIETLDDVSILERVWNELFISKWFSDQQLALGLFRRHAALRLRLSVQTNYVTFLLLRDHNVDAVYRLVELTLAHDMMHECQKVLGLLFDYQCKKKFD